MKEEYDSSKLLQTILRHGATEEEAKAVLVEIEKELYEGIKTREIMRLMDKNLERFLKPKPVKRDLRSAIGLMRSKPDFEEYARRLLDAEGYRVITNQVIQGYCVTHEIDGVAFKDGKTFYVETKHHSTKHGFTPFAVTLAAKAKFDDIKHGYNEGLNEYDFDRVIIICNTRLTDHASQYAECVGIEHIGWKAPHNDGIESIATRNNLYPVTILITLTKDEYGKLSDLGIITLNDFINNKKNVPIKDSRLKELVEEVERLVNKN